MLISESENCIAVVALAWGCRAADLHRLYALNNIRELYGVICPTENVLRRVSYKVNQPYVQTHLAQVIQTMWPVQVLRPVERYGFAVIRILQRIA
jgi:hypothetical protein